MASYPDLKPILYTYDPFAFPITISHELERFNFVKSTASVGALRQYENSIEIDPVVLGLPWISYIPSGRQCKHWGHAHSAAKALLGTIRSLKPADAGDLPKGFSKSSESNGLTLKEEATITTAVNAAICLNPEASVERISLIAKVYLLAWMQDDVREFDANRNSESMVEVITRDWPGILDNPGLTVVDTTHALTGVAQELINEDPVLGREVMNGLLCFIYSNSREVFSGFRDFVDCRVHDVGAEFTLACVRFANKIRLTPEEKKPMETLLNLTYDHIIFVNDLYSYEKERQEHDKEGAAIMNTVHYLQQDLSTSPETAKHITHVFITETEHKMHNELHRLLSLSSLSETQIRYAFAMIECATGNVLYSLTSKRYGRSAAVKYQPPCRQGLWEWVVDVYCQLMNLQQSWRKLLLF